MKRMVKITSIICLTVILGLFMLTGCELIGLTIPGSHTHTEIIDKAVAPTCTEDGLTEGKHCSECKEVIKEQQIVKALGHAEVLDKAVDPTCTESGLTEGKHCSRCDLVIDEQKKVEPLGHTVVIDEAVTPTCNQTGLTEGKYCSVCYEILVEQEIVASLGHAYGEWVVIQEPTTTETGTKRSECENCGAYRTSVIAALTHDHNDWDVIIIDAVAPTCTTPGLTEGKMCSGCGETLVDQKTVAANGHKKVTDAAIAPTCTKDGLTEGSHCSVCNEVLKEQQTVVAQGHNYSLVAVAGAAGVFAEKCTSCDDVKEYSGTVTYEDYGAVGDGVTDDSEAIRKAHNIANTYGVSVKAKAGATYYIGKILQTIVIRTDTDWNGATFIIDDSQIKWNDKSHRGVNVFTVYPDASSYTISVPEGLTVTKGQTNIGMTFDEPCMLKIENSNEKIYIRYGENANSGVGKNEIILVDENGNVDPSTPIQYDYSAITKITVFSLNEKPISIGNGKLITIAPNPKQQDASYDNNYCYYSRGIMIQRSNLTLHDIEHSVIGEDMTLDIDRNDDGINDKWHEDKSYGVPYAGFFYFKACNNVTMTDCTVQGHQAYSFWQGEARNEMGSYDITATDCVNLSLINVTQYENEQTGEVITNRFMYHGVMSSNFCRNMVVDNCYLDRFDSHQGLHSAKITNSTLGFGILVIGGGELYIENVTRLSGDAFILLRTDYNSVFDGDVIIKNCTAGGGINNIITGIWRSFYNGLPNYMARSITIDGLTVESNKIVIYKVSGAVSSATTDSVNKLYLPEAIAISGVKRSNGAEVGVQISAYNDAFATLDPNVHQHTWDSGVIISNPSATDCTPGVVKYTCTDASCGIVRTATIHSDKPHSSLTHTITDGVITYTCHKCNASFSPSEGYAMDGSDHSAMEGVSNAGRGFATAENSENPIIRQDGDNKYYELLRESVNKEAQFQLWLPSMTYTLDELTSANNATGYLSFKININTDAGLGVKFVDIKSNNNPNRWKPGGCIVEDFFTVSAPSGTLKTVKITGWDGLVLKSVNTAFNDNGFTGWIDVKFIFELSEADDSVTVHYYVDGSYVGTRTRELTTLGNCISGIYISGRTSTVGTGLLLDDVAFGCSFEKSTGN